MTAEAQSGWLWEGEPHPWDWFSLEQLDEIASYGVEEARIRAAIKRQKANEAQSGEQGCQHEWKHVIVTPVVLRPGGVYFKGIRARCHACGETMAWGKNQYEIDGEEGASYVALEFALSTAKAALRGASANYHHAANHHGTPNDCTMPFCVEYRAALDRLAQSSGKGESDG